MRLFGREIEGIPATLVVLVAIFLLSSGLCGITNSIEQHNGWNSWGPGLPNTSFGNALGFAIWIGFFGVIGSGLAIALLLLVWPIVAISNRLYGNQNSRSEDGLQRLFDHEDGDE